LIGDSPLCIIATPKCSNRKIVIIEIIIDLCEQNFRQKEYEQQKCFLEYGFHGVEKEFNIKHRDSNYVRVISQKLFFNESRSYWSHRNGGKRNVKSVRGTKFPR